jgi:hypothetical protein
MEARVARVARVSARFSKPLARRRFRPVERDAKDPAVEVMLCDLSNGAPVSRNLGDAIEPCSSDRPHRAITYAARPALKNGSHARFNARRRVA